MRNRHLTVLLAVLFASCQPKQINPGDPQPSQLLKVSQALSMMGSVTAESTMTIIDMNRGGVLDKVQTAAVLGVLEKVARGGKDATETVRKLNALSDADKRNLSTIIAPLLTAINDGMTTVANMGPDSQVKVRAVLLAVQSTVAVLQAILEVK